MIVKVFVILWTIFATLETYTASSLRLDSSNKFQNLLVYINDDIAEGDGTLLANIKDHIKTFSSSLWKATGNMKPNKASVQLGTVYIRVPKTWNMNANQITWQQCNKADFYVTKNRNDNNTEPFTKQLGKCGEPADFTKFPELFFKTKNNKDLVKAGKEILNEFVRLRYGVFSEKPYRNMLTIFNGITFINSTCGSDIKWTINQEQPVCSDKNKICNYTLDKIQSQNYSMMFDTDTPEIEYFCNDDDKPHNKWAQSLQNIKCDRKSISSVILQHEDFKFDKPSQSFENTNFLIVKGQNRKIILVLDVSSSMTSIIDNMRKACVTFLKDVVEETASVGLVSFSTTATILSYSQIMNPNNRQSLIAIIGSLIANGYTNIPDGIIKGIQLLGGDINNDDKVFGTIILLSDGGNNVESPYKYDYAIERAIQKGVLVNVICYGNLADAKLNILTNNTGGRYLYADPNTPYTDLVAKFSAKQSCDESVHQIKMIEGAINVQISGSLAETNLIKLDKYIGKNVGITVTSTHYISNYIVNLLSPSGKVIQPSQIIVQPSGTTLTFNIIGKPEIGMYKLQTRLKTSKRYKRQTNTLSIRFTVSAIPDTHSRIINPVGELSSSEINMLTDTSSIKATVDLTTCGITKDEKVTINLTMTPPSNIDKTMAMMDDGLGDDNIDDDKIYTKILFSKDLQDVGFYSFIANIELYNEKTKEKIKRTIELGSMRVKAKTTKVFEDKVAPSKIEYVDIVILNSIDKSLKIGFLATGDDEIDGNISDYQIRIKSSGGEIIRQEKLNLKPKMKAELIFTLTKENVTNPFEISVRGIDDNQNTGEWSLTKYSNWNYLSIAEESSQKFYADNGAPYTMFSIFLVSLISLFSVFYIF